MTNITLNEQRLEQRLPALGTTVKIRRRGLGFNPWRYDLNLVDLSANGMALYSPVLKFSPLQKIDFELSSGGLNTFGCAIVCYAGNNEKRQRYGLLFIETDKDFDAFLTGEYLSSVEIKRLSEEIAEQYMYQRIADEGALFRVQNQRMIDAVMTLAGRLGQMGLYITNEHGRVVLPADSLEVGNNSGISMPIQLTGDTDIKRTDIFIINGEEVQKVRYQIAGGPVFDNIIDLLNHLCQCFDQISAS